MLFFAPIAAAVVRVDRGASEVVATLASVATLGLVAWILERVRPERREHTRPDQPAWMEAAHFFVGVELGYALAMGLCELAHRALALSVWPMRWPLAVQIVLAVVIYEAVSYWQHRLFHRSRRLWAFHALHHAGGRVNVVRVGRFHADDIAVPTFVGYVPLVLLARLRGRSACSESSSASSVSSSTRTSACGRPCGSTTSSARLPCIGSIMREAAP